MSPSASEVEEAPGASVFFSLKPITDELEGGHHIGTILLAALTDLVAGRRPAGGSAPKEGGSGGDGSGGGGSSSDSGGGGGRKLKQTLPMVSASGGSARVRVRYDAHLPSLSLQDGEQTRPTPLRLQTPSPSY